MTSRRWSSFSTGKLIALAMGPVLGAFAWAALWMAGLGVDACWCAAVTTLCAVWWVTEPIPIPATSLVPFAAFPLTDVLSHKEVASAYGHSLILLLLGGFILSTAMEKAGAHRRLALIMVRAFGWAGGRGLVLGFMVAAGFLSMWISNTATTLMLLPIALAVVSQSESKSLTIPLLLGTAYAANIGGIGTPVGTPPNVILMGVYAERTGTEIAFIDWMLIGVPIVLLLLPLTWLWLTRRLSFRTGGVDLPVQGPWRFEEILVLAVFATTALAWVTRAAPMGGWAGLLGVKGVGDATVALGAVVVMFLLPNGRGGQLLDWKTAAKIPWGLLILFGGGLSIAKAFGKSGLSAALGELLSTLALWPVIAMMIVLCLAVTFLTEVTSNTATTALLMPILAAAGIAAGIDPALLMVPAAISASCAFMLPVATAPNAIVFGTGHFTTVRMMREGFAINLLGAVLITGVCLLMLDTDGEASKVDSDGFLVTAQSPDPLACVEDTDCIAAPRLDELGCCVQAQWMSQSQAYKAWSDGHAARSSCGKMDCPDPSKVMGAPAQCVLDVQCVQGQCRDECDPRGQAPNR